MTYEEIHEYVLNAGSADVGTFGGRHTGGYHVFQSPEEITKAIVFLRDKGTFNNYLEVGAAAGGTTRLLTDLVDIKNVYVVDNNNFMQCSLRKQNLQHLNVKEYIGHSHSEECRRHVASWGVRFDMIFIDADHSYHAVRDDTKMMVKFLEEDGLMMFHDSIAFDGVRTWVSELKNGSMPELKFVDEFDSTNMKSFGLALFKHVGRALLL